MFSRMISLVAAGFLLCMASFAGAAGDEPALRLTTLSVSGELAPGDARIAETRKLLDQASQQTGEEHRAIASACQRYVGHLRDAAQIRATPLELLKALAAYGKAGQSMQETLQAYVAARKSAPGRSHDEAMRTMAARR